MGANWAVLGVRDVRGVVRVRIAMFELAAPSHIVVESDWGGFLFVSGVGGGLVLFTVRCTKQYASRISV